MGLVCETERLQLRQFRLEDLAALDAMHSDPEVGRFLGGVRTLERTRQNLEQWLYEYQHYGYSKWAVVLRSTGELIGRCGISVENIEGVDERELGWTFARSQWGHGYATEATAAAMSYCFRMLRLPRLISLIDGQNFASARVAIKLGMNLERMVEWHGQPTNLYARGAFGATDCG
jgi:[ribosomal protein S5]-alanine N-acetyltransferase